MTDRASATGEAGPPIRGTAGLSPAERARRAVARRILVDRSGGPDGTIVVAGSGRSGTTWLAEVLTRALRARYLFEPFHPDRLPEVRTFAARQYMAPGEAAPRLVGPVEAILGGRVRHPWVDQHNEVVVARRRVVKDVWANLLLGWMSRAHPGTPLVLVLRHPCAVIASQMRMRAWDWHVDPAELLRQGSLMADHLEPYRVALASARSGPERFAATWCAENLVPLRQLGRGRVHVVLYERLAAEPEAGLRALFGFLGRPWVPEVLASAARPSALAPSEGDGAPGPGEGGERGGRLAPDEATEVLRMVERFGLDRLYGHDPFPLVEQGDDALAG